MVNWGTTNTQPDRRLVDSGSFWPDIDTNEFYDVYRIPADLPTDTVITYLRTGIINCRHALDEWLREQIESGYTLLTDIPQETIDGEKELVLLWNRAVFCSAKAELMRETETVNRREQAENSAKTGEETEDKYREFAADAISLIAGVQSISIETI